MSEARERLRKALIKTLEKTSPKEQTRTGEEELRHLADLKRQEEKTKEDIKRKKEELSLKREAQLAKIKHEVHAAIEDERSSIQLYEKLNNMFKEVPSTANLDIRQTIEDEKRHLERFEWIFNNLPKH